MIKKRTKNHDVDGFVCPAPEKMPVAGAQEGMWPPRKALNISKGAKNGYWRLVLAGQPTGEVAEASVEASV